MEKKVIKTTQEILNNIDDDVDLEEFKAESYAYNIKADVNQLLFLHLPDDTTIREAEALAVTITDMIINPDTYTKSK